MKSGFVASLVAAVFSCRALAAQYYVDCSQRSPGSGSRADPWNSLSQVNQPTFGPGDIIAFRAGSTCKGTLSPKGSGNASSFILITKYMTDATTGNPVINGNGLLAHLSNLTVTNPASGLAARQGIHVTATDGRTHTGIVIDSNFVHTVAGQTNKQTHARDFSLSCGILIDVAGGGGNRYDNVLVKANRVSDCGGGGIKLRVGSMSNRGQKAHVTNNTIDSCGGDGIIVSSSNEPLIDYNVASNLGKGTYPYTGGNFAGMWVLGDHNPVISHNVVYGSIMSRDDSQAFDCDWGNTGNCTVEYNYSHDNAGGAFLNCDGCGKSGGANQFVRYNIFQNDCRINSVGNTATKLYFYNNVMYCPDKSFDIKVPKDTWFTNNIFVGDNRSALPTRDGIRWRWNVFQNVEPPSDNGIPGDPGFVDPGKGGDDLGSVQGYQLKSTSPALSNGEVISNNGGRDFYGNEVSATEKPHRGAYNGRGV